MVSRMNLWRTVSLLSLAAALPATQVSADEEIDRPNVVLIMADDMPVNQLWVMDDTLRLLADQGTTYTNAVVEYALCCPSRATWLTGVFSHNHGITSNKGGYQKFKRSPWFRSNVATWMQDAGYTTAHIGKFLNGYGGANPTEIPPGWDHWCGTVADTAYRYHGYKLNCDGHVTLTQQYQTDKLADLAVQQIAELAAGGPFLMEITGLAPHTQSGKTYAIPSDEYAGTHAGETYRPPNFNNTGSAARPPIQRFGALTAAEREQIDHAYPAALETLESLDDLVARVVAALTASGELDNTLIVFTSDHGYFNGQFGLALGKIHPYEPALNVPLLVRGPGFGAGVVDHRLSVNADLTATVLSVAGALLPSGVAGEQRQAPVPDGEPDGSIHGRLADGNEVAGPQRVGLKPVGNSATTSEGAVSHAPIVLDGVPLTDLFADRAVPLFGIAGTKTYRGVRTDTEVWWTINNTVAEHYDLTDDPWQLQNLTTSAGKWKLDAERQALIAELGACDGAGCQVTWAGG